jgi:hypothetical protein
MQAYSMHVHVYGRVFNLSSTLPACHVDSDHLRYIHVAPLQVVILLLSTMLQAAGSCASQVASSQQRQAVP